ncbi:hypothetical protein CY35_01G101400 [Sphagnum magellanicum]|nr:hypothetical protein CY35_01G101400 [Sphagnum magellanicum]
MLRATGHRVARHLLQQRRHRGQDARRSRPLVRRAKREATVAPRAVKISEGQEFWDTPTIKMAVGMVAVIVVAKLTMLYDESQEPERLERQAKEFAEAQANLTPLTKEQWEEIQELRPRTPFESRLARNHARIRTGEPLSLEDIKDWAIDVLTDAMARKEDNLRQ